MTDTADLIARLEEATEGNYTLSNAVGDFIGAVWILALLVKCTEGTG